MHPSLVLLQEFTPSPEGFGQAVTMGAFVRDIFIEQVTVRSHFEHFALLCLSTTAYALKVCRK